LTRVLYTSVATCVRTVGMGMGVNSCTYKKTTAPTVPAGATHVVFFTLSVGLHVGSCNSVYWMTRIMEAMGRMEGYRAVSLIGGCSIFFFNLFFCLFFYTENMLGKEKSSGKSDDG